MSNEDLPIKATRKSSISSVPSREQLLESAAAYFANEMRTMKQRRTKIIATLSDTVNSADDIRNFLLSGMNIIRVTMAYCSQKITSQSLEIIMKNKALIEKEQGCFIPIIMDTKGSTLRIGSFDTPGGEITLKKGQEFRICTNKKIKGNQHIVSCDDSDLGNLVTVGDTLVIDYGRNVLVVKGIEKESDSMAHLNDQFPPRTDTPLLPKRVQLLKKSSFNEGYSCSSNEEDMSETSPKSAEDLGGEEKNQATEEGNDNPDAEKQEDKTPRRRFRMAFQKKKKTEKDVIVCEAVSDCRIQSGKALFIQERARANPKTYNKKAFSMPEGHSEDLEESSCIGVKDIKDLNLAVKLDIDAVAITGVQSRKDVDEARFILGQKSHIRVISKIQNAESLENFDEILEASDGIIISRSYLSMHIPVEKLFFKQKEMINKCHAAGKPVTITTQVLDSMVMGLVPTSSEINDIANLILDGVDSFTLVSETLYGLHKREALETLSRICYEIEYNQILSHQRQMTKPETLRIHDIFSPSPPTGDYLIPQIDPSTTPDTIAECVIKAVYDLDASLIVSFTQTGSTILKISKLRAPCPIVAVTVDEKVARQVSLLASVTAVKVGSMYGKEGLTQKVIEIGLEKKWVKKGDFIVICFGEVDFTGATNSLRIIKVQ